MAISKNGIKRITHLALETAFVRLGMPAEDVCTAAHIFDFKAPRSLVRRYTGPRAKPRNARMINPVVKFDDIGVNH
ncbi:MAG: hypothetical protein JRN61_04795 [Nitrososphaerota archaeon]|nr:hypothetical protein [Nitrososphaerota archaeon]